MGPRPRLDGHRRRRHRPPPRLPGRLRRALCGQGTGLHHLRGHRRLAAGGGGRTAADLGRSPRRMAQARQDRRRPSPPRRLAVRGAAVTNGAVPGERPVVVAAAGAVGAVAVAVAGLTLSWLTLGAYTLWLRRAVRTRMVRALRVHLPADGGAEVAGVGPAGGAITPSADALLAAQLVGYGAAGTVTVAGNGHSPRPFSPTAARSG